MNTNHFRNHGNDTDNADRGAVAPRVVAVLCQAPKAYQAFAQSSERGTPEIRRAGWRRASGSERVKRLYKKNKRPRGLTLSAPIFSGGELSLALLYGDHQSDAAVLQIDAERVGGLAFRLLVAIVEDPEATA